MKEFELLEDNVRVTLGKCPGVCEGHSKGRKCIFNL